MLYALNSYHHHHIIIIIIIIIPPPLPLLILYVFCLTTGPQPLPKRVRHCDLVLPFQFSRIFLFPQGHSVASYFFFLVFPSRIFFLLSAFTDVF